MIIEEKFTHMPAFRPEPEADAVGRAVELLRTAERPVIVVGGGARSSAAGSEVVELAEKLSIPVATSLDGKDAFPDTHPLNVGIVGSYSRWCANRLVSEADLVLYIGSGTGDQVTNDWTIPRIGTAVIQIDIDPSELGRSYPNAVSLLGDAKVTLRQDDRARHGEAEQPEMDRAGAAAPQRLANGDGTLLQFGRHTDPHGAALPGDQRRLSRRRDPGVGYRLCQHLDGGDGELQPAGAELTSGRRDLSAGHSRRRWAPNAALPRDRWSVSSATAGSITT